MAGAPRPGSAEIEGHDEELTVEICIHCACVLLGHEAGAVSIAENMKNVY